MISPDWVRMMARYNAWQNAWLVPALTDLGPDAAEADRGLFFGSIRRTASHLLWGDEVWLSRFMGAPIDGGGMDNSLDWAPTLADWAARRPRIDADIRDWAADLESCDGDVTWYSPMLGREASRPKSTLYTHFFNHQTHHRGQLHAALTALGRDTSTTDLLFMPEDA